MWVSLRICLAGTTCVLPKQAAVYTARAGKGGARRVKARSCHAPARRLARTTISLGPEEGILFGLRAIRFQLAFVLHALWDGISSFLALQLTSHSAKELFNL
jgi:hypothetical protein